jgi:hypothetical protein
MTSICARRARFAAVVSALILDAMLCGCSGGSSSPAAALAPPAPVTGLATPTSMAVVTATNTQNAP